jgi:DNA-binding FadR family transcriptional regulator
MRATLSSQVQQQIRQYVITHGLAPGDPLPPEGELVRLLDVGKTSVREAVRSLETMGVVEVRHGRGLFVGSFKFDPIIEHLPYGLLVDDVPFRELLQVRRGLEEGLIVEAAKKLTAEDLADLDALVERMRNESVDGVVPPEVDRAFHQALYSSLGNRFVSQLIDVFWQVYQRIGAQTQHSRHHTVEDHAAIVTAIRSADPHAMTRAVAAHFSDIVQAVDDIERETGPVGA